MENDEYVSMTEYRAMIAGLLAANAAMIESINQITQTLQALAVVLCQRGIVTPELWDKCIDEAARLEKVKATSDQVQAIHRVAEDLRGDATIQDILKIFTGTVQ